MTPDEQGRFCAYCQKSVVDFTGWSDKMLYDFFTTTKESVCGHFDSGQLNRTISIPPQRRSKLYRIAIALGLTVLAAQAQEARARVMPPLVAQSMFSANPNNDTADTDTIVIKGQVLDEKKEPMTGVIVQLEKEDGTAIAGIATNIDGCFNVRTKNLQILSRFMQLRISYTGYEQKLIRFFLDCSLDITPTILEPDNRCRPTTGEVIIINREFRLPLIDAGKPGPNKTFTTKDIHNMGY